MIARLARLARLALLAVLAGCGLDAIPAGVCGNLVREANEDCDDPSGTCDECFLRCQPATDGLEPTCEDAAHAVTRSGQCCPSGFECGVDDRCHAVSGELELADTHEFEVEEIAIGDAGFAPGGDLLGISPDAIRVRVGEGPAAFEQQVAIATQSGAWTFADFDSSDPDILGSRRMLDVLFATPGAVTGYAGSETGLIAFPFTSFGTALAQDEPARFIPIVAGMQIVPALLDDDLCAGEPCVELVWAEAVVDGIQPCGGTYTLAEVLGDEVPVTPVGPSARIAIGLRSATDGTDLACTYDADPLAQDFGTAFVLAFPAGTRLGEDGSLVFADVDGGDGCAELVVPLAAGDTSLTGIVRTGPAPGCVLASTIEVVTDSLDVVPLRAANLDGAGPDELVTTAGVARITLGATPALVSDPGAMAPRRWDTATITDWNGDGRQDVVGVVDDVHGIDVLRALPGPGGYSATRIETSANVLRVRGGDFDGDLYGDVLFLEDGDSLTASVAYGQPAGGQPAIVPVARFGAVGDLFPERLLGPGGPDNATDVIVTHEGGGSLFFGAGSRQLTAPLFLGQGPSPARPYKLLVADFSHEPATDAQHWPDLIAVDPGDPSMSQLAAFYGFGRGPGVFDLSATPRTVPLADATYEGVTPSPSAPDRATVWTWLRDAAPPGPGQRSTGRYPVALSATTNQLVVFDPIPGKTLVTELAIPAGLGAPRAAFPHPAPGSPLIASFDGGIVRSFVVSRSGPGPSDPFVIDTTQDLTGILSDQGFPGCGHATTMWLGRVGGEAAIAAPELVFACEDGTTTKLVVLTETTVRARLLADLGRMDPVAQLAAGDLTGDGVDDLVVLIDSDPRTAIHLVQCPRRGETLECVGLPSVPTDPGDRVIRPWLVAGALACALIAALARPAAADVREEAERFYRLGEKAFQRQAYDVAAENFDEAYARLPLADIAYAAAQAHRLQYYVDRKPPRVARAIELYRFYVTTVKEGGRRGDAALSLAELEGVQRELGAAAATGAAAPLRGTALAISPNVTEGVQATIDGKDVPILRRVDVEPGERTVRVVADGYFPAQKVVTAIADVYFPVEIALAPRPAKIEVRTEPGAVITVDGRRVPARAPRAAFELAPGKHTLAILRRGRAAWVRELDVGRDERTVIVAPLARSPRRRAVRWLVIGGGITLAAAIGTATVTGVAIAEAEDLQDERRSEGITAAQLTRYNTLRDRSELYAGLTAGFATVTAAAGITALTLYWFDSPSYAGAVVAPMITTDGAGLTLGGTF